MRAGELAVGDQVLVSVKDYELTDDQWQVILGGSFGDGSLRQVGTHAATFRVGHGEAQKDYLRWKHEMLAPFARAIAPTGRGFGFDTLAMPALADLRTDYYGDNGRIAAAAALDRLDARGLAVWYGDDGSFAGSYARWGKGKAVLYNTALKGESRQRVVATMERLGLGRPRDDGRGFWFDAAQTARLHDLIAPYVHPAVDHKLHPSQRGRFRWHPNITPIDLKSAELPARGARQDREDLRQAPDAVDEPLRPRGRRPPHLPGRRRRRPQLARDDHRWARAEVLRVDPPGRPSHRDASSRAPTRSGNRTKVKVVKNKLAPPFREAEFDMIFGEGISKSGTVLDAGVEQGIIEKSGTWYSYKNERIGQGRENAKKWLQENQAVLLDLEMKIRETLGLRAATPVK